MRRISTGSIPSNEVRLQNKTQDTYEEGFAYMDQPNTMILSKRKAEKYFPGIDPVGNVFYLNDDKHHPYTVGGVFADLPENSHLQYDFFLTLTGKPVQNIHLGYYIEDSHSHGDRRFVWLFGAVAVFILALAVINFINLSTARSANRAKEV